MRLGASLSSGWQQVRFQELLAEPVRNGVYKGKEFHGRGARVVNMGELFGHDFISAQEMKRVELTDSEARVASLKDGDLLFARRSLVLAGSGKCSLVVRPPELTTFESSIIRARPDRRLVEPRFLFYLFRSPIGRAAVASIATQTAVSGIRGSELAELVLPIPPISEQLRVAGILSTYDDLIENSQRRIRILETMARALYREWFVHFRFPGHENVPRLASPLGEIPKGWDVVALDALKADQRYAINGGPFGSKLVSRDYVDAGVPVIRGSNLSESGRFDASEFVFVGEEKAEELHANVAVPGDIVITQRGTLGQIGMIPSGIGYMRFVISQSQMKVTLDPPAVNREYAFFFLRSDEAQQRIRNLASSSGVPHINLATLREFQILLPPRGLQEKFGTFALGTEAAIEQLTRQIDNLRRTRDLLLPRLLSAPLNLPSV